MYQAGKGPFKRHGLFNPRLSAGVPITRNLVTRLDRSFDSGRGWPRSGGRNSRALSRSMRRSGILPCCRGELGSFPVGTLTGRTTSVRCSGFVFLVPEFRRKGLLFLVCYDNVTCYMTYSLDGFFDGLSDGLMSLTRSKTSFTHFAVNSSVRHVNSEFV